MFFMGRGVTLVLILWLMSMFWHIYAGSKQKVLRNMVRLSLLGAVVFRWERRVILLGFGLSAHLH